MKITFLGAAKTVTGSKYLIEDGGQRLLVDCGLFQGHKELRLRNWDPLPVAAKSIQAVILTHAHLDHSGYLPLLVKQGFNGPIFATQATRDLCEVILLDSGRLQEEDAWRANKYGYSKHKPALALYTEKEAARTIKQFKIVPFDQTRNLSDNLNFTFSRSGHILGSAFVTLKSPKITVAFSGDVGRLKDPLMKPPARMGSADYLLLESTYGAREHPDIDPGKQLAKIINHAVQRQGKVIVAAFAVGRAQTVLYYISKLKEEGQIPKNLPVFLDTPMGQEATDIFCRSPDENRLDEEARNNVCSVARYIRSFEESEKLAFSEEPCVIIASSGMAEGGRVLQHIKIFGPDKKNSIVFTGYQAGGTRGDRLLSGEKKVKIYGEYVPIEAEVALLQNLSSHADAAELIQWLRGFEKPPKTTFLTHGEDEGASALKARIESELGWNVYIPSYLESLNLVSG